MFLPKGTVSPCLCPHSQSTPLSIIFFKLPSSDPVECAMCFPQALRDAIGRAEWKTEYTPVGVSVVSGRCVCENTICTYWVMTKKGHSQESLTNIGIKEEFPTVECHIFKKVRPMLRLLLTCGGGGNGFISSMGDVSSGPSL